MVRLNKRYWETWFEWWSVEIRDVSSMCGIERSRRQDWEGGRVRVQFRLEQGGRRVPDFSEWTKSNVTDVYTEGLYVSSNV